MADISRAMNTPPPAAQQPQAAPQPTSSRTPAGPDPRFGHDAPDANAKEIARVAKNERDRLRRKAQRAAALKEAEAAAAKPKKKKAKKKKTGRVHALTNAAVAPTKKAKRRRGRPPGAKNKPKLGLAVALVPTPDVLRATAKHADAFGVLHTATNAIYTLPATERTNVMNMLNRLFS